MNLPEHITPEFNLDEAIFLAELCQRAHQLFTHKVGDDIGNLYDALYQDPAWHFAHTIDVASGYSLGAVRVLIVQKVNQQQYAVVFWVNEPNPHAPSQTRTQSKPRPEGAHNGGAQVIGVTHLASEEEAKDEAAGSPLGADKAGSVAYPPLPGEIAPPPLGVRVYGEWLAAVATCQDAIEQFFAERMSVSGSPATGSTANEVELYLTGHGAGGCLAALGALYLKRRWEARIDFPFFSLKMINFGSPKLGNKAFVDYYHKHMKGFSYRVQNLLDSATYGPALTTPFPYNLQLLLPGVDYVRNGDEYYMTYEHIGEPYILAGVGNSPAEFHFRSPISLMVLLPFTHSAAGYKQMLIEMRKFQETYWKPAQRFAAGFEKQRKQLVAVFQKQGAEIQKAVEEVQIKVTK